MAAPRYTDAVQIFIVGDQQVGSIYIPEARKLLGFVMEGAKFANLGTNSFRRELKDGAVLLAEKFGQIPRITIIPPKPGGKKKPIRLFEDLVVSDGVNGFDGLTRVRQPVILHPRIEEEDGPVVGWKPFFYNSSSPGYSDGAGTYREVFPQGNADRDDPEIDLYASGHDWWNEKGEHIQYHSVLPYWTPAYRHPNTLYGTQVFHMGRAMFDGSKYEDEEGGFLDYPQVLGAAIRNGWLYVMQAELGYLDYTPRPSVASFMHDAWMSPPLADTTDTFVLRRYRYAIETDKVTFVQRYVVLNGTHEELWTETLTRGYSPWLFSQDCTSLVSYQVPSGNSLLYRAGEIDAPIGPPGERWEINIDIDDDADTASAEFFFESAGNRVAEEWGTTMRLVNTGMNSWEYQWGDGFSYPAYYLDIGVGEVCNQLAYFDLRTNRGVIYERRDNTYEASPYSRTCRVLIWDNGSIEEFATGELDPVSSFDTDLDKSLYTKIRFDVSDAGVEGLPFMYMRVNGVVWSAEVPEDGFDEPYVATSNPTIGRTLPDALVTTGTPGVNNGGMSYSSQNDEDETAWNWDTPAIGFGISNSIAPQHPGTLNVFYVTFSAISSPKWLYYSDPGDFVGTSSSVAYITAGDLPALLNGAFADNLTYSQGILGVPPITQQKERDE